MESQVKPGQVWEGKNGEQQMQVDEDGHDWVFGHNVPNGVKCAFPKHILLEDYVLVKEAP